MASTADANFISQQRSLSRMHDADRVDRVLEHVFGDEDGEGIGSFQIDDCGYHFSDEVVEGWTRPRSLRERSPASYGIKIIDWLDGLSDEEKKTISQTGSFKDAQLDGWTAFEDQANGHDVLTFVPGWSSSRS